MLVPLLNGLQLGELDLQLIVNLLLIEHIDLHGLYFVEIVFDERDVLPIIELVHLKLELWMVCLELLHK